MGRGAPWQADTLTPRLRAMSNPSDQYRQLLSQYQKAREEMRTAPRDGLQEELQTLARRVIAFECKNETERLKSLIATHHEAAAKIELARQKLQKLERAVISQEILIAARFPESDVIGLTLDLIAFEAVGANRRASGRESHRRCR